MRPSRRVGVEIAEKATESQGVRGRGQFSKTSCPGSNQYSMFRVLCHSARPFGVSAYSTLGAERSVDSDLRRSPVRSSALNVETSVAGLPTRRQRDRSLNLRGPLLPRTETTQIPHFFPATSSVPRRGHGYSARSIVGAILREHIAAVYRA